jgi:hypothetical protein
VSDFDDVAPIFPVRDTSAAAAHYERLGFTVTDNGFPHYRFARRGDVYIHLARFDELDPATNSSAAYFYVADADELHDEWTTSGAGGRFTHVEETDYGLREGAHIDPDGNLLRYGSWIAGPPEG